MVPAFQDLHPAFSESNVTVNTDFCLDKIFIGNPQVEYMFQFFFKGKTKSLIIISNISLVSFLTIQHPQDTHSQSHVLSLPRSVTMA